MNSALFVFLVSAGLFIFGELSAFAMRRSHSWRLRERAQEKKFGAVTGRALLQRAEQVQLSLSLLKAVSAFVGGVSLVHLISPVAASLSISPGNFFLLEIVAVLVASFGISMVSHVIRMVFRSGPDALLCAFAPGIRLISKILSPFATILLQGSEKILTTLKIPIGPRAAQDASAETITELVDRGAEAGQIEPAEQEMIERVFKMSATLVNEVMTRRQDIISAPESATLEDLLGQFAREGVSRLIVTGSSVDDVKGFIVAKDLLRYLALNAPAFRLKDLERPIHVVQGSRKVDEVLQEFRSKQIHIAAVVDEHGGTDGVVTIEDLIEEVFGEIFDEHDVPSREVKISRVKHGEWLVHGSVTADEFFRATGWQLPDGDFETLAGLVIEKLGHIPSSGERVDLEGLLIKVEQATAQKIGLLRVAKISTTEVQKAG